MNFSQKLLKASRCICFLAVVILGLSTIIGTGSSSSSSNGDDPSVDLSGTWEMYTDGQYEAMVELDQSGSTIHGTITHPSEYRDWEIEGTVEGNSVEFFLILPDGREWTRHIGTISDSATNMSGTWSDPEGSGEWSGEKNSSEPELHHFLVALEHKGYERWLNNKDELYMNVMVGISEEAEVEVQWNNQTAAMKSYDWPFTDSIEYLAILEEFHPQTTSFAEWHTTYTLRINGETVSKIEPSQFTKLDFAEPYFKDGVIFFNTVDGANGYRLRVYNNNDGEVGEMVEQSDYYSKNSTAWSYQNGTISYEGFGHYIGNHDFILGVMAVHWDDSGGYNKRSRYYRIF